MSREGERCKEYHKKYYQEHKECLNERRRKYYQEHREQMDEHDKIYKRKHVLGTMINGKKVTFWGLNKRPYPEKDRCEICGEENMRLNYHHWDDNNPNQGIWSCNKCHALVELDDEGGYALIFELLEVYHMLRQVIR